MTFHLPTLVAIAGCPDPYVASPHLFGMFRLDMRQAVLQSDVGMCTVCGICTMVSTAIWFHGNL